MPLRVHARKIFKAWVIPWERDSKLYGIAYETAAGWHGVDKIGTRAEAEAALRSIGLEQSGRPSEVVQPFAKSTAAS
jgi:hypothetical protein